MEVTKDVIQKCHAIDYNTLTADVVDRVKYLFLDFIAVAARGALSDSSECVQRIIVGSDNAPEGTMVVSEDQTKGKGRLGRVWISPKAKGVYCSLILRPPISPAEAGKITLMTSVSVVKTIRFFISLPFPRR